jgi:hypothetical protein
MGLSIDKKRKLRLANIERLKAHKAACSTAQHIADLTASAEWNRAREASMNLPSPGPLTRSIAASLIPE